MWTSPSLLWSEYPSHLHATLFFDLSLFFTSPPWFTCLFTHFPIPFLLFRAKFPPLRFGGFGLVCSLSLAGFDPGRGNKNSIIVLDSGRRSFFCRVRVLFPLLLCFSCVIAE